MKVKLYHPSNKLFDKVKVKYFGQNLYTKSDIKSSSLNRSFWYFDITIPERIFKNCHYLYTVEIDKDRLYNLEEDKDKIKSQFENENDLLLHLKKKYLGVSYKPNGYEIVSIFYDMIPKEILVKK